MSLYEGEVNVAYHRGAVFTVELGSLVENGFDLGLKDYPIFDESYRAGLNTKIVEHYFFREIGLETPQLFKRFLNRKMNEIMPYYNQLYETTLHKFDPYSNYEMNTTGTSKGKSDQTRDYVHDENAVTTATGTTGNTASSKARTLVSATPQMQLSGNEDYATNITDSTSSSTSSGDSTQNSEAKTAANDTTRANAFTQEDYVTHVSGLTGITGSQALMQFRQTLMNIDMMVIDDLGELFMGVYTDYWNAL